MISQKTKENLEKYCSNVIKWNKAYNLLSSSQTATELWERHILDSTQVFEHFPESAKIIADFGSGAGFPAIPCAIISKEKNDKKEYHLFESVNKKATFLEDTKRILELDNTNIHCKRVENFSDIKADVITARAFAKISEIFQISRDFLKPTTKFILLKGKNCDEETTEAKRKFNFDFQKINSKTGDGFIFIAENLELLKI